MSRVRERSPRRASGLTSATPAGRGVKGSALPASFFDRQSRCSARCARPRPLPAPRGWLRPPADQRSLTYGRPGRRCSSQAEASTRTTRLRSSLSAPNRSCQNGRARGARENALRLRTVPWCSGLAYVPVKDEIAGSNPVGTARRAVAPPGAGPFSWTPPRLRHPNVKSVSWGGPKSSRGRGATPHLPRRREFVGQAAPEIPRGGFSALHTLNGSHKSDVEAHRVGSVSGFRPSPTDAGYARIARALRSAQRE